METRLSVAKNVIKINRHKGICSCVVFLLMSFFLTSTSFAISPIAHTDVVPYQRIHFGETFNFGVIAFSKPGIDRVEFAISGLGYVNGDKISNSMTLNTRVASDLYNGAYEYHVPISSSEFFGDGTITVTPKVYDNDGNVRELYPVTLVVEGSTPDYNRVRAWVDAANSDGMGSVGDEDDPFPTIQSAINAAQAENNDTSSGNVIYLANGTYSFAGLKASTSGEYLTITRKNGTYRENVVVNQGKPRIQRLKVQGLTLESNGADDFVLNSSAIRLWADGCHLKGSGRNIKNSGAILYNIQAQLSRQKQYYATNNYTTDSYNAYGAANLIRGALVEGVRNDVFGNFVFVVNSIATDLNNGTTSLGQEGVHSDALQVYHNNAKTIPVENRLAYNVYVTDAHYQGIMRTSNFQQAKNNAFVNVFIEMRDPTNYDKKPGLKSGIIGSGDDHLLMWNCSFPYSHISIKAQNTTNSSFVGNLFWQVLDTATPHQTTEWLHNHFMYAYDVTGIDNCTPTSAGVIDKKDCPRPTSKLMDTGANTSSYGDGVIDISNPNSPDFGYPLPGSALIDALPRTYVPVDALGNERDSDPDIGALEYTDGEVVTDCETSGSSFQHTEISRQESDFVVKADITANTDNMDAVTSFGAIAGTNYSDYAILVRLNTQGTIDARNDGLYTSDVTVNYTAGAVYSFEIHVDIIAKTYDVYVTPASTGVKMMVANDYSFRTEQADTSEFNYYAFRSNFGTHDVCNVEITTAEE